MSTTEDLYLGTFDISKESLIACIPNNHELIKNLDTELYQIIVFRKEKIMNICKICTYEFPGKVCDMCGMPSNVSTLDDVSTSEPEFPPGLAPVAPELVDTAPVDTVAPQSILSLLDSDSDDFELVPVKKKIPKFESIPEVSDTKSVISDDTLVPIIKNKLAEEHVTTKLYMKGWVEKDCPFTTDQVNNLIKHFNNAICRASQIRADYIKGMYQLGKSKTSAMIVFKNDQAANAAQQLDNNILFNGVYLRLKRPDGYPKIDSINMIKMNIVREMPGMNLAALPPKEIKRKETNVNIINYKALAPVIKPVIQKVEKKELSDDQKKLVDLLRAELRKSAMECLQMLCSRGNETSIFYDATFELCQILDKHKVISCVSVNNKTFIVKEIGQYGQSYNVTFRSKGQHLMMHEIANIRTLLMSVNFPVKEFI